MPPKNTAAEVARGQIMKGNCLCGQVTYSINTKRYEGAGLCHCKDCQLQTGSAFSTIMIILRKDLTVRGPTKRFTKTVENQDDAANPKQSTTHRVFCSVCGSPIAHYSDSTPTLIFMKAGTLEERDKAGFDPGWDAWWDSRMEKMNLTPIADWYYEKNYGAGHVSV